MRKLFSLALFTLFFAHFAIAQHRGVFFGVNGKNDECFGMLNNSDKSFMFYGIVDNDAALYKFDCAGNIVDSVREDLSYPSSFEAFRDVVELPNGDFLAVGYAKVINPSRDLVLLMRFNADLEKLDFDTILVNGKAANAYKIGVLNNRYFIGGYIAGADFGDVFWSEIDPQTLGLIGNVTVFSYGLDELNGVSNTADGGFLLTGTGVTGNFLCPQCTLNCKAFIRKIKPDGSLVWEHVREEMIVTKFGKVSYNAAYETPFGNIIATGTHFSGDTLLNGLDGRVALFGPSGSPLDTVDLPMPGQQNINITLPFVIPGIYALGGDSSALVAGNNRGPVTSIFGENNGQLVVLDFSSSMLPFAIKGMINVPNQRIAFAGVLYDPAEGNSATNKDVFVALPIITVEIDFDGCELSSNITSEGSDMEAYQWYLDGDLIPGATDNKHIPAASGEYQLLITDLEGCQGVSESQVLSVQLPEAAFTFVQNNLTLSFTNNSTNAAFYAWDFGDGNISSSPNPVHTYAAAGSYLIRLEVGDLCDNFRDTSFTIVGVTGTENPAWLEQFKVWPNPTSSAFTVELQGDDLGDVYIQLFDARGQRAYDALLLSNAGLLRHSIDAQSLPVGTYLLRVSTRQGSSGLRVVKN
jgi:PKD domain/Secretion system C-terminal sorting domain